MKGQAGDMKDQDTIYEGSRIRDEGPIERDEGSKTDMKDP